MKIQCFVSILIPIDVFILHIEKNNQSLNLDRFVSTHFGH